MRQTGRAKSVKRLRAICEESEETIPGDALGKLILSEINWSEWRCSRKSAEDFPATVQRWGRKRR